MYNDWNKQLIEKLDFAKNAIDEFRLASPIGQKRICNCLGWNWVLQGKKLTFSMHKWFIDIEDFKNYLEQNKTALEPIKTFEEYRQSSYYDHTRLIMRRM